MKTEYKYLHFIKTGQKAKTSVWSCRNNHSAVELGEIKWYPAWRQYCYFPAARAVYSAGCLEDIRDFIGQLQKERTVVATHDNAI